MQTAETTNGKLAELRERLKTLIGWAQADAEQSFENDALEQWHDDMQRAKLLRKALALLDVCDR